MFRNSKIKKCRLNAFRILNLNFGRLRVLAFRRYGLNSFFRRAVNINRNGFKIGNITRQTFTWQSFCKKIRDWCWYFDFTPSWQSWFMALQWQSLQSRTNVQPMCTNNVQKQCAQQMCTSNVHNQCAQTMCKKMCNQCAAQPMQPMCTNNVHKQCSQPMCTTNVPKGPSGAKTRVVLYYTSLWGRVGMKFKTGVIDRSSPSQIPTNHLDVFSVFFCLLFSLYLWKVAIQFLGKSES